MSTTTDKNVMEYKCPCCGGGIKFDSASQNMKCPYCDTEFETETLKNYDEVLKNRPVNDMSWESVPSNEWKEGETDNLSVYICKSCGGEIVCDNTTAATHCPFCGNPVIMSGQFSGDLRPDYVIPFKLDKKAAKEALRNHLKGKTMLTKVFKDENHIDEITGVYVPFWLFDAEANADINYRATRVRTWSDSDYDYTDTSFYSIIRGGNIAFEHVPVDGSSKMADDLMESIEPFNFDEAVDFQTAYLSGFFADKYDVTAEQSIARANQRIQQSTEDAFARTVNGYSTVTPESTSIQLANGKTKYALYPVWVLTTSWNGEQYIFAMNGQTGKFVGNLPVDKGAYWKWLLGLTGAVGAAIFAILTLFWTIL